MIRKGGAFEAADTEYGRLKSVVSSHMHKLQKSPTRVRKYFRHPSIRYEA
jgi:hypothetical protein